MACRQSSPAGFHRKKRKHSVCRIPHHLMLSKRAMETVRTIVFGIFSPASFPSEEGTGRMKEASSDLSECEKHLHQSNLIFCWQTCQCLEKTQKIMNLKKWNNNQNSSLRINQGLNLNCSYIPDVTQFSISRNVSQDEFIMYKCSMAIKKGCHTTCMIILALHLHSLKQLKNTSTSISKNNENINRYLF